MHVLVSDIAIFVLKRDVKLQLTNQVHVTDKQRDKRTERQQRIRGVTIMRYTNLHFTYLLTYSTVRERIAETGSVADWACSEPAALGRDCVILRHALGPGDVTLINCYSVVSTELVV